MLNPTEHSEETLKNHGLDTEFGVTTCTTTFSIYIVILETGVERFGVYLTHGVAGGAFWKNRAPLVRKTTLEEAQETASELFGLSNAGKLAKIIAY